MQPSHRHPLSSAMASPTSTPSALSTRDKWGLAEAAASTTAWSGFKTARARRASRRCACVPQPRERVDVIALAAASRADVDCAARPGAAAGCRGSSAPRDLAGPAAAMASASSRRTACRSRFRATWRSGRARDIGALGRPCRCKISHIVLHSPDHQAVVRFFIDVLGFRVSATGSATSCASCAAIERITASPPARAAVPEPRRLRHARRRRHDARRRAAAQRTASTSLGPGPPHGRQQHLQLLRHAERLRGRIHRRARAGRRRHRQPKVYEPAPGSWTSGASASAGRRRCRTPRPIRACSSPPRSDRWRCSSTSRTTSGTSSVAMALESGGQIGEIDRHVPADARRPRRAARTPARRVHRAVGARWPTS